MRENQRLVVKRKKIAVVHCEIINRRLKRIVWRWVHGFFFLTLFEHLIRKQLFHSGKIRTWQKLFWNRFHSYLHLRKKERKKSKQRGRFFLLFPDWFHFEKWTISENKITTHFLFSSVILNNTYSFCCFVLSVDT